MSHSLQSFRVRSATPDDAEALCEILNIIIAKGGMTAIGAPLSHAEFYEYFLGGMSSLMCLVAMDPFVSLLLGFQALNRHVELPNDWADIGTFTRIDPKTPGVGKALFAETKNWAKEHNLAAINAAIRADNHGGLAYYEKMGFRTYQVAKAVPLHDGTPVDRIFKEFIVENPS
jgi:RimJ/RimL family protein N-acetyltransferase